MTWLRDWFSVTEKTLERWARRGQWQRLAELLGNDERQELHEAAVDKLDACLEEHRPSLGASDLDLLASILGNWVDHKSETCFKWLGKWVKSLSSGVRTQLFVRLAASNSGRPWLVQLLVDPETSSEVAAAAFECLGAKRSDLAHVPDDLDPDSAGARRVLQMLRSMLDESRPGKLLRPLMQRGEKAVARAASHLAQEIVDGSLSAGETLEGAALGLGTELSRQLPGWLPKLMESVSRPNLLLRLISEVAREWNPEEAVSRLLSFQGRLDSDDPGRAELFEVLKSMGVSADFWRQTYEQASRTAREWLVDMAVERGELTSFAADVLVEVILSEQGNPERIDRIVTLLSDSVASEVLHKAYAAVKPETRQLLFEALGRSERVRPVFYEKIILNSAEPPERRKLAVIRLFEVSSASSLLDLLSQLDGAGKVAIEPLLLEIYLDEQETSEPLASVLLEQILTASDERLEAIMDQFDAAETIPPRARKLVEQIGVKHGESGLLVRQLEKAAGPVRDLLYPIAQRRIQKRLLGYPPLPLAPNEALLLKKLATADLGWFRTLIRRAATPDVLCDAVLLVAGNLRRDEGPFELLCAYYRQRGISDSVARKIIKTLVKYQAGAEVYASLYNHSSRSLRLKVLQILREHPRVSELSLSFLGNVLLDEHSGRQSRGCVLHILERRGELNRLVDFYKQADSRGKAILFSLCEKVPSVGKEFYESVLLDLKEDSKRRFHAALWISRHSDRGGLSRWLEKRPSECHHEIRRWLVNRYLNRATPTLEATALLKSMAPCRPEDLLGVLETAASETSFEGRLLELGRTATAREGGVAVLVRLLREAGEALGSVAQTLAREHLEQRAAGGEQGTFEGVDFELAVELSVRDKDWLAKIVDATPKPRELESLVTAVRERMPDDQTLADLAVKVAPVPAIEEPEREEPEGEADTAQDEAAPDEAETEAEAAQADVEPEVEADLEPEEPQADVEPEAKAETEAEEPQADVEPEVEAKSGEMEPEAEADLEPEAKAETEAEEPQADVEPEAEAKPEAKAETEAEEPQADVEPEARAETEPEEPQADVETEGEADTAQDEAAPDEAETEPEEPQANLGSKARAETEPEEPQADVETEGEADLEPEAQAETETEEPQADAETEGEADLEPEAQAETAPEEPQADAETEGEADTAQDEAAPDEAETETEEPQANLGSKAQAETAREEPQADVEPEVEADLEPEEAQAEEAEEEAEAGTDSCALDEPSDSSEPKFLM